MASPPGQHVTYAATARNAWILHIAGLRHNVTVLGAFVTRADASLFDRQFGYRAVLIAERSSARREAPPGDGKASSSSGARRLGNVSASIPESDHLRWKRLNLGAAGGHEIKICLHRRLKGEPESRNDSLYSDNAPLYDDVLRIRSLSSGDGLMIACSTLIKSCDASGFCEHERLPGRPMRPGWRPPADTEKMTSALSKSNDSDDIGQFAAAACAYPAGSIIDSPASVYDGQRYFPKDHHPDLSDEWGSIGIFPVQRAPSHSHQLSLN